MRLFFSAWVALTALACLFVASAARLDPAPMPAANAQRWALAALEAAQARRSLPDAPSEASRYRAFGAVIVLAWREGRAVARYVGRDGFANTVRDAAQRFAIDPVLQTSTSGVRFTVTLELDRGTWWRAVPFLAELSVVPLVEGVSIALGDRSAYLTPDEITSRGLWDSAIKTPIPDLTFGLSPTKIAERLAKELGASPADILERGAFSRFAAGTIAADAYPREEAVTLASLERGARESAKFLLRHQLPSGRFVYRYDASRDRERKGSGYSLPRHAGTAYFLAQAGRVLRMPEAREGARLALAWVRRVAFRHCGGERLGCVARDDFPDMGAAALTALAAAELLAGGDDPEVRDMLEQLTAFVRSMQRKDGELMHVYDLRAQKPIDVQKMYYSGEAAVALLASHRVLHDERDLVAVRPLMQHLTGAGWSFFGSRYFYGEEHWTCQAVAAAADRIQVPGGLDFCLRWLSYQHALMYRKGETPWPVAGAIGVGPVIVPRLTSVASRVEAGAPIYALALKSDRDVAELRAQMHAHLELLMRMRWAPGPAHLFRDPEAALGGVPATQASLEVRNDFVQHAGSAMLAWAERFYLSGAHARPPSTR